MASSSSDASNASKSKNTVRGFVTVTAEHAKSGKIPRIPPEVTDISRSHLFLDAAQKISIEKMYAEGSDVMLHTFDPRNENDQLRAASLLAMARLNIESRESAGNKWAIRWSDTKGTVGKETKQRVLYQWCVFIVDDLSMLILSPALADTTTRYSIGKRATLPWNLRAA